MCPFTKAGGERQHGYVPFDTLAKTS
jgi:hypothetical protein